MNRNNSYEKGSNVTLLKVIIYGAVIFLTAIFQSTVASRFGFLGTTPAIMLALTCGAACYEDERVSSVIGLASGLCADALGKYCPVDAYIVEARNVEPEKEWPVCSQSHSLSIAKVVLPRCGIVHHLYFKFTLRSLFVTDCGLVPKILATGNVALEQSVVLFVYDI